MVGRKDGGVSYVGWVVLFFFQNGILGVKEKLGFWLKQGNVASFSLRLILLKNKDDLG